LAYQVAWPAGSCGDFPSDLLAEEAAADFARLDAEQVRVTVRVRVS